MKITAFNVSLTVFLAAVALLLLSACGSNGPSFEYEEFTQKDLQQIEPALELYQKTKYARPELENLNYGWVTKETIQAVLQKPASGFNTDHGVFILEPFPLFDPCYSIVHEWSHLSSLHRTGDVDANHLDTYAFYDLPSEICSTLPDFQKENQ